MGRACTAWVAAVLILLLGAGHVCSQPQATGQISQRMRDFASAIEARPLALRQAFHSTMCSVLSLAGQLHPPLSQVTSTASDPNVLLTMPAWVSLPQAGQQALRVGLWAARHATCGVRMRPSIKSGTLRDESPTFKWPRNPDAVQQIGQIPIAAWRKLFGEAWATVSANVLFAEMYIPYHYLVWLANPASLYFRLSKAYSCSHRCDCPGCIDMRHIEPYFSVVENNMRRDCSHGIRLIVAAPGIVLKICMCACAAAVSMMSGSLDNACTQVHVDWLDSDTYDVEAQVRSLYRGDEETIKQCLATIERVRTEGESLIAAHTN